MVCVSSCVQLKEVGTEMILQGHLGKKKNKPDPFYHVAIRSWHTAGFRGKPVPCPTLLSYPAELERTEKSEGSKGEREQRHRVRKERGS